MLTFESRAALHIIADRGMAEMLAGQQRAAAGRADRATAIEVREPHSFGRHAVKVRRLDLPLPVATQIAITEIVGEDQNDVRIASGIRRNAERYYGRPENCSHDARK